jgi:hypothetical protein
MRRWNAMSSSSSIDRSGRECMSATSQAMIVLPELTGIAPQLKRRDLGSRN